VVLFESLHLCHKALSMSKRKPDQFGMVYSTNPEYSFSVPQSEPTLAEPAHQKLRIYLDRLPGNREATRITGFAGSDEVLQDLGKLLKTKCGVGGNVKNGEVLLQGNHRDKVLAYLLELGYKQTKKSGG